MASNWLSLPSTHLWKLLAVWWTVTTMCWMLEACQLPNKPKRPQDLSDLKVDRSLVQQGAELGKGEFGQVYKGVLSKPGQAPLGVALKTLQQAENRDEFLSEAKVMMQMDHENVVKLLGVILEQPMTLIVEFVQHGDLHAYLKKHRKHEDTRNPELLHSYCVQICLGMEHLCSRGLVHRDLAARNVLVASRSVVKVADFGLSKMLGDSDCYTAAGRGRWPIKWYAPESIYYMRFHEKSDVWSFGVTCWEVFSQGRKPWPMKNGTQAVEIINNGGRLAKPEHCPDALYKVLRKCWKLDEKLRPTFTELIPMIEAASPQPDVEPVMSEEQYGEIQRSQRAFDLPSTEPVARQPLSRHTSASVKQSSANIDMAKLTLGAMLGKGSFGYVKQGTYQTSRGSRDVAVKVLQHGDEEGYLALTKEAELMKDLRSPYLVQLIGVAVDDTLYLVTEYLPLGPLNNYLRKGRNNNDPAVNIDNLISFVANIVSGMAFMESRHMVHRDLAARNVMVASPTSCKISDFGLSRALDSGDEYYRSSNRGRWPIKWYAPECLYHSKFNSKSDVWSFGVTCWEVFSYGQTPYGGMKGSEVVEYIAAGHRLQAPPETPEWSARMLQQCWLEDATTRPSFDELAKLLQQHV
eukprot:m.179089 g.179089  ORF g.179089 m.179089 type:complete len:634 (-) comp16843_c0_seq25:57-1958(-)